MTQVTFLAAGTGVIGSTGTLTVSKTGCIAGNVVVLQQLIDGTSGAPGASNHVNVYNVNSEDSVGLAQVAFVGVGGAAPASQSIYMGRVIADGTVSADFAGITDDIYARWYEFGNVSSGGQRRVIENGIPHDGAPLTANGDLIGVNDVNVTTLGPERLACNFVACNDDNTIGPFTGMTGGTWSEATAEFLSATGTDGMLQLQIATMALPGTIGGGAVNMSAADPWGVVGFALKPNELPEILIPPYRYW